MDSTSENFKQMVQKGYEIDDTQAYDPTNPAARDFFWNQFVGKLFAQGWDAFWLDSSEPEEAWPQVGDAILRDKQLHIGSGLEYTNIFPLEHTDNVAQHWKQADPEKRVFLLTRSAFMGQQRVGATVWSGDVYSSWWALRRQVPAGLNFALSGYPYWTTDIGGYHPLNYAQDYAAGLSGALRALVRVRRILSRLPYPRSSRSQRAMGLRPGVSHSFRRRSPALPAVALRLFTGLEGHQRGLHHPAATGDGLPRGSGHVGDWRPIHVRAWPSCKPGPDRARNFPFGLSAGGG